MPARSNRSPRGAASSPGGGAARTAVLVGVVLALLAAAPAAVGAPVRFAPPVHHDGVDSRKASLDLRAAAFGQVGTQLSLTLRTRRAWSANRPLCVALRRGRPVGRLCVVADRSGRSRVRFRGDRVRGAHVEISGRTLRLLVFPHALGLSPGRFSWFIRGGKDRVPDAGTAPLQVSAYGAPHCFGAASRDPETPCENPALRRLVTPRPVDAELMHDFPCVPHRHARDYKVLRPCLFGARYVPGPTRFALVGDSHSMSLRQSAEVAAEALGWKAVAFAQSSCPFATKTQPGYTPLPKSCRRQTLGVLRWLRSHPSVHALMTTARSDRGVSAEEFRSTFERVPASVRHIYVVRDVPWVSYKTEGCVGRVRREHAVSAGACAVKRSDALPPDPAAEAATQSGPRVHLIDLSPFFCSDTECFPVVGGAYVYRDTHHINSVFAGTLGPYLLRAMTGAQRQA